MSTILNQIFADVNLCGEAVSVQSEVVTTDVINLTVEKEASCKFVLVGHDLCYTVTITNDSDVDFTTEEGGLGGIIFRDPLASNLTYVADSFNYEIDGGEPVFVEPAIDGNNVMTYDSIELEAGQTAVVKFCVTVGLPATDNENGDSEEAV